MPVPVPVQHKQLLTELESKLAAADGACEKYEVKFSEASKTVRGRPLCVLRAAGRLCARSAAVLLFMFSNYACVVCIVMVLSFPPPQSGCVVLLQLSALKGGIQSLFSRIGCSEK